MKYIQAKLGLRNEKNHILLNYGLIERELWRKTLVPKDLQIFTNVFSSVKHTSKKARKCFKISNKATESFFLLIKQCYSLNRDLPVTVKVSTNYAWFLKCQN